MDGPSEGSLDGTVLGDELGNIEGILDGAPDGSDDGPGVLVGTSCAAEAANKGLWQYESAKQFEKLPLQQASLPSTTQEVCSQRLSDR